MSYGQDAGPAPRPWAEATRERWFNSRLRKFKTTRYARLERLGSAEHSWDLPGDLDLTGATCYSIDSHSSHAFATEMANRFGCRLRRISPGGVPATSADAAAVIGRDAEQVLGSPGSGIPNVMYEIGDDKIDVLHLDIAGNEYEILRSVDLRGLGVRVLCVAFYASRPANEALTLIAAIQGQGFVAVGRAGANRFTFVRPADR